MEKADLPDTLPGLDVQGGLRRIGGNLPAYLKLLTKFAKNQADAAAEIGNALRAGDISLAERRAHSLAGVAGNIGAQALHDRARSLETGLRDGRLEDGPPESDRIKASLGETISSIETLTVAFGPGVESPTSDRAPDPVRAKKLIAELHRALEACETRASDIFTDLKAHLPREGCTTLADAVEAALGRYDFDGAAAGLRALEAALEKRGHP